MHAALHDELPAAGVPGEGAAARRLFPWVNARVADRAWAGARRLPHERRDRWNLLLDDGVVVKLPETGWRKQLDALEHLIVDKGILERDVMEIDLRSPTQYFFVTKTDAQKDKKTVRGRAI